MELTYVQLKSLIGNHIDRIGGLQGGMEMMINAMMKSERMALLGGAQIPSRKIFKQLCQGNLKKQFN